MGLFTLRREIRDMERLKEILSILADRGLHRLVRGAGLQHLILRKVVTPAGEHTPTPVFVRETLEALGPTFVKLGQILSLRPDLVPTAYCEEFRNLQAHVAPLSYPVVKGIIEHEYGVAIDRRFKEFDHDPLAAGSVSQVHLATLSDGTPVAVKVLRPGIRDLMARDTDLMAFLARRLEKRFPELQLPALIEEFRQYTERELDLTFERSNLARFHEFFKEESGVRIPLPYEEVSTGRVLVMDRLSGGTLADTKLSRADKKRVAHQYFNAMLAQIFRLGVFHADPHPGNIIVQKKSIGLLDFGIVGFLDETLQERLLYFLHSLYVRDARGVVWALLKIGNRTSNCDAKALRQAVASLILDWHDTKLQDARFSLLVYRLILTANEHGLQIPSDIVLLAKSLLTMEGTAAELDPNLNLTRETRPYIDSLLRKRWSPASLKESLTHGSSVARDLLEEAPLAVEALMGRLQDGNLDFRFNPRQMQRLEAQWELESAKGTLAIISGALFMGSALIAGFAPELRFLGWPLAYWGFLLFLVCFVMFVHSSMKSHRFINN